MKSVAKTTEEGAVFYLELTEDEVEALWKESKPNGYSVDTYRKFTDHLLDFMAKQRKSKLERIHHNQVPDGFEALR